MRIVYYADDGREFDTEAECRKYERRLSDLMFELQNGIHAYDDNGDEISFNNCELEWLEELFQDISYIKFDNKKAIDVFLMQAADIGLNKINEDLQRELIVGERYFYDWDKEKWVCLEDKQRELDKIARIFE
jgi:hypothetical protein